MGGAVFTIEALTRKEAKSKLKEKLQEARAIGLYNERSRIKKDRATGLWTVYVAVHS